MKSIVVSFIVLVAIGLSFAEEKECKTNADCQPTECCAVIPLSRPGVTRYTCKAYYTEEQGCWFGTMAQTCGCAKGLHCAPPTQERPYHKCLKDQE